MNSKALLSARQAIARHAVLLYAVLMLVLAFAYARYDTYTMDGDGVAFLDISQFLTDGHAHLAINGYWNPGYPAVLALARELAHPGMWTDSQRWTELALARYANVAIFAFAMLACYFFTAGLIRLRARFGSSAYALPDDAVHLLGLGLLVFSIGRELPLSAVRADTLLLALLLLAAGFVLRLQLEAKLWRYAALGVTLGCAYLVKSFAFLPSMLLLVAFFVGALRRKPPLRSPALAGVGVAALLFALLAGPYIVAISRQLGHPTTGDSARLNYCFFVDHTARWHEANSNDLGHATGPFLHPERLLSTPPPVFSYAAHAIGTQPIWFDPAWWTLGLKPHIWLKGELQRIARCVALLFRFLLARPEILVLLAVLLAFGARLPKRRDVRLWAASVAWGLLMLAIYFPVDLQDRYLTAPFLLVSLPIFAALSWRASESAASPKTAMALVILFAGIAVMQGTTYILDVRRHTPDFYRGVAGYSPQMYGAAHALNDLELKPGQAVACLGDAACIPDPYWARLAGSQIIAEIETPDQTDPQLTWNAIGDKQKVAAELAATGSRFLVAQFGNTLNKPNGWRRLGDTDFFAYPLQTRQ